ncbi:MAG: signal peptidase I, partial [Planctomycetota bacterium]
AKVRNDSARDTIESIVVAFIFAFVVRAFEAEAFVIPTGSMANTLMGRHKEIDCPECGYHFRVGASSELDPGSGLLIGRLGKAVCPNCRYRSDIKDHPPFRGDRIVAAKFPYDLADPGRWEVLVFKFPDDPATNYIKRLVGLPGETIEVRQGDLYRLESETDGLPGRAEVLRKDPLRRQRALEFVVHDFDRPAKTLLASGWPERWAAVEFDDAPGGVAGWSDDAAGWRLDAASRSFTLDGSADDESWIRYRHYAPPRSDWDAVERGIPDSADPRLVLDFCGYNGTQPEAGFGRLDEGVYWVGDLSVECDVTIDEVADGGSVTLELVEGLRRYRCRIDVTTGVATLTVGEGDGPGVEIATAETSFLGTGGRTLWFANVDDRLRLSVDGVEADFGDAASYVPFGGVRVQMPTEADLTPVGIAAEGVSATVGGLKVFRDIYYRGEFAFPEDPVLANEFRRLFDGRRISEVSLPPERLAAQADDPERYGQTYRQTLLTTKYGADIFRLTLDDDEFLMLGDNSPQSLDGRSWPGEHGMWYRSHRHAVKRSALVGRALFILWPHAIPIGNETEDGVARGWPIPGVPGLSYHRRYVDKNGDGQADGVGYDMDYQQFGVPFYPNFWRLLRPVR